MTRDNRVLVSDAKAAEGGDFQNTCYGRLAYPGEKMSNMGNDGNEDPFRYNLFLRVLGGARITYYDKSNYMGRPTTYSTGAYKIVRSTDDSFNNNFAAVKSTSFSLDVRRSCLSRVLCTIWCSSRRVSCCCP